ncbi:MAG: ring-cleaving dioxygenase [Paenibacillaceae bacterium]|jgi:glyoxalase family protein|nr:ring-cleaving dioxygenase [Paenibacillaceae bacterium]
MMKLQSAGIHHITAFAGNPQDNVDFYAGILGLRLVKKTVNFDAPHVYHLYFGNEEGSPGTVITFFPSAGSRRGQAGGGQVGITTYAVPAGALGFWEKRLQHYGVEAKTTERFGEQYLQFRDNEGMLLELVERSAGPDSKWSFNGVPADQAIKGFGGAVLHSVNPEATAAALTEALDLKQIAADKGFARFQAAGALGNLIDLRQEKMTRGEGGAGTVHHIAWRAKDSAQHVQWQEKIAKLGYRVTDILDRQYFHALYFREGGGILFEIATDPPGFARDEDPEALGGRLMLPEWYEPQRTEIEANLLPVAVRRIEGVER